MRPQNQKLTPGEKAALKGRLFDQLGLPQPESPPVARVRPLTKWTIVVAPVSLIIAAPLVYRFEKPNALFPA